MVFNQITGTENNDFLFDTDLDDEIFALGGNDEIETTNGNDIIYGNDGTDTLIVNYSSFNEDISFHLQNYDQYIGDGLLEIYFPENSIYNYINFYSIEKLIFSSGSGQDNIDLGYDNYSDDTVNAGAGDDYISTGRGYDVVNGGSGYDLLNLDFSNSISGVTSSLSNSNSGEYFSDDSSVEFQNIEAVNVFGSFYDDVLVAPLGHSNSPYMPMMSMIEGNDGYDQLVVDYSERNSDLNIYSYGGDSGNLDINSDLTGNYNSLNYGSIESFKITTGRGNDDIDLGYDNYSDDTVNAGAGDDYIDGKAGDDYIDGNTGDDILIGDAGDDTIIGGAGNDTMIGFNPLLSDSISEEQDSLKGDSGNDTFVLGDDNQTYYGNNGNLDWVIIQDFSSVDDTIQLHGKMSNYQLQNDGSNTNILYGESNELIGVINNVTGLNLADSGFEFLNDKPQMYGTENADTIIGGDSDQDLRGMAGDDIVNGLAGNDSVRGLDGDDTLYGGTGNDTMYGHDGEDVLIGVDILSDNPGAGEKDLLTGNGDNDLFVLGDENQAYYQFASTADFARINDFELPNDTIQLHGSMSNYQLQNDGSNTNILYGESNELIGVIKNVTGLDLNNSEFTYL